MEKHVYDPRANLPYVSQVAGVRTSLPYSSPVPMYNYSNKVTRYPASSYQHGSNSLNKSLKTSSKETTNRNKYVGPKIDINFD